MAAIASKLRQGAPFLIYLYYAFDNRPAWFRWIWRISEVLRFVISRMPPLLRYVASQIIALTVYWPLARIAWLVERAGLSPAFIPLEAYRARSLYVMRTDAYDRFCTRLEKRFTRAEIAHMLTEAGFENIQFSERVPFWCAVARKGYPVR